MFIVRCAVCAQTLDRKLASGTRAEPADYPNSAIVCGTPGCLRPGLVWLWGRDALEYRQGQRVHFSLGRLGSVDDIVGPDHDKAAVVELRRMTGGLPVEKWLEFGLKAFDLVQTTNAEPKKST